MNHDDSAPREFRIVGMDCAEEIAVLKSALGPLVGDPERLSFDLLNGVMAVPAGVPAAAVVAAVAGTGMQAALLSAEIPANDDAALDAQRRRGVALTAAAGAGVVLGMLAEWRNLGGFANAAYLVASVAGTWSVLPKALSAARRLRPDMNLLMVVAVVGAWLIGQSAEAATVAFLFALSLALEAWSLARARNAVRALLELTPPTARIERAGVLVEIPVAEVPVGAVFIVNPGERVPLDGAILVGESSLDQAPLTGESVPVAKSPGDPVMAGSINGEGRIEVRSAKLAADTTLARIVGMVGAAGARRSHAERWVEKFAAVYTPAVMVLALIVALALPTVFGKTWRESVYEALALLVIACPCALVVSTPVTIVAATAAAARRGVLVKGGAIVEAPGTVKAIAFDKTGTLTVGKPAVLDCVPLGATTADELLRIAAALEANTDHPLAKAVLEYARARVGAVAPAADFRILPGRGAEGRIDGVVYWAGSRRLAEERGAVAADVSRRLDEFQRLGRTPVVVGTAESAVGLFALADAVRPEAAAALAELRALGIASLTMLTGDDDGPAAAIADAVGLTGFRAKLLPQDKVEALDALVREHGSVAMVGDGVNDAPAMARATFGVAMGLGGSDAAIETSDVTLMAEDLRALPWLVRHSRRARAVIRQNVAFALLVKAGFAAATLLGYATMWGAVAADAGATVIVVLNGLRLLGAPPVDGFVPSLAKRESSGG